MPGSAMAIFDARGQAVAARWEGSRAAVVAGAACRRLGLDRGDAPRAAGDCMARPQRFGGTDDDHPRREPTRGRRARAARGPARRCWSAFRSLLRWPAIGGLWLASIGLRPITQMARRAARIPLSGMQDLGESTRRRRARAAGHRHSTGWWHGCGRPVRPSVNSWPMPRTSCARRCSVIRIGGRRDALPRIIATNRSIAKR